MRIEGGILRITLTVAVLWCGAADAHHHIEALWKGDAYRDFAAEVAGEFEQFADDIEHDLTGQEIYVQIIRDKLSQQTAELFASPDDAMRFFAKIALGEASDGELKSIYEDSSPRFWLVALLSAMPPGEALTRLLRPLRSQNAPQISIQQAVILAAVLRHHREDLLDGLEQRVSDSLFLRLVCLGRDVCDVFDGDPNKTIPDAAKKFSIKALLKFTTVSAVIVFAASSIISALPAGDPRFYHLPPTVPFADDPKHDDYFRILNLGMYVGYSIAGIRIVGPPLAMGLRSIRDLAKRTIDDISGKMKSVTKAFNETSGITVTELEDFRDLREFSIAELHQDNCVTFEMIRPLIAY